MYTSKKNFVILILALALLLLIVHAPRIVRSAELTHQEKALGFLANVVGLDLARYELELKSYEDYSSYTSTAYDAEAKYNLVGKQSNDCEVLVQE
jgi:hypothetical protein